MEIMDSFLESYQNKNCLNQNFVKIYKISRIVENLGNLENLMKIKVQNKKNVTFAFLK